MKKLLLALSIIGAITIGAGAITFASDNNGDAIKQDTTVNGEITNNEENYINENPYCTYYGESNETENSEYGKGDVDGQQSKYKNRGRCGSSRRNIMRY